MSVNNKIHVLCYGVVTDPSFVTDHLKGYDGLTMFDCVIYTDNLELKPLYNFNSKLKE